MSERKLPAHLRDLVQRAEAADHPIFGLAVADGWTVRLRHSDIGSGWETTQDGVTLYYYRESSRVWVVSGSTFGVNDRLSVEDSIKLDAVSMVESQLRVGGDDDESVDDEGSWLLDESATYELAQSRRAKVRDIVDRIVGNGPSNLSIPVDGGAVEFRVLRHENAWLARATIEGTACVLMGDGEQLDDLTMAHIADLSPYVEGTIEEAGDWWSDEDDSDHDSEHEFDMHGHWGTSADPECRIALEAFALALTEGRASEAATLLVSDITKKYGNATEYALRLSAVLDDAGPMNFRAMMHPMPYEEGDDVWASLWVTELRADSVPSSSHNKTIQLLMRHRDGWKVDLDLLDPTYYPRMPDSEINYRKMMGFEQYENLSFSTFGLANWDGPLGIGGSSSSGRGITSLALIHGDPYDEGGSQVTVEASTEHEPLDNALYQLASSMLPRDKDASRKEMRDLHRQHEDLAQKLRLQDRVATLIKVDGEEVEFETLVPAENCYSGQAHIGDVFVTVTGIAVPLADIELVTVSDLEPYFDGSVQSMKRMSEKAKAEHDAQYGDDDDERPAQVVQVIVTSEADSDEGAEVLDFCLELVNKLERPDPVEIAGMTSARVIGENRTVEEYAVELESALASRKLIHVGWGDQPHRVDSTSYEAAVQLLFAGDNPLKRWRTLRFVVEGETPKLDTDIGELARHGQ